MTLRGELTLISTPTNSMDAITELEGNANPGFKIVNAYIASVKDVNYLYFTHKKYQFYSSQCESGDFAQSNKILFCFC